MGILEPGLQRFVDAQIASGRHATADEVMEAALRYYREAQEVLDEHDATVREEAERGIADIEAGRYVTIEDPSQFHAMFQDKLDRLETAMLKERDGEGA